MKLLWYVMTAFLRVLDITAGMRTHSVVMADKEDIGSNRKYLQSINIHTG